MQSRRGGRWWADQQGTEYSGDDVSAARADSRFEVVLSDESEGVLVCRDRDREELKHLVRIPPPAASRDEQAAFYEQWDVQGYPPRPPRR